MSHPHHLEHRVIAVGPPPHPQKSSASSSSSSARLSSTLTNLPWKQIGGGALLTAAAALAYIIYRKTQQYSHSGTCCGHTPSPTASPETNDTLAEPFDIRDILGADGEQLVEEQLAPSEAAFRALCGQFLSQLGEGGPADPELEGIIRAGLPQCATEFNPATRTLAAHLLLATNAHHLMAARSEEEFNQLMEKQRVDMETAWSLLECPTVTSDDEIRSLDVLRIQVSQCLRDAGRMLPLFERMSSRPMEEWQPEESVLLFTAAPLLGRWDDTVRFGDHLSQLQPLSNFHSASMNYEVLYEMAKEQRQKGNTPVESLAWREYKIRSQRIRMREAKCENPAVLADIEAQFTADGEKVWQLIGVSPASEVVRCGALVQIKSFSPAGVALVGPADDKEFWAKGQFPLGEPSSRQVETYRMKRVTAEEMEGGDAEEEKQWQQQADAEGEEGEVLFWKGSYEMLQVQDDPRSANPLFSPPASTPPPEPALTVIFDFEMICQRYRANN